jgi:hypothetical protein
MDGLMSDTKDKIDQSILPDARKAFERAEQAESKNRDLGLDDKKFALLGEQWPEAIRKQREADGRPCLTINRMPAFIRQVVNDARQNKPSIKVHPASDQADADTANVINGIVRNIEQISSADVAYDTAVENAVTASVGYIRVKLDYAYDDSFDMDILIERVSNPFSVYGDPNSTCADGSGWNSCFILEQFSKDEFERKYGEKSKVSWDSEAWNDTSATWRDDDKITVAEYWTREEVEREIVQLSDGTVLDKAELETNPDLIQMLEIGLIQIKRERVAKSHKVTQRIMTGVEVLEENEHPGKFIPIAVVYGDEFDINGERHTRSLIHPAKDAARMNNYWRTTSTELVALAPKVPYIGPEGAFVAPEKWQTANTVNYAYLEYDAEAGPAPQRQPLDTGPAAGALQEAMNASDDIKNILGLHDASLGARSNETSGRAILARQREGDTSTFHFIDNLSRAIRHTGRIILDLIPHVYNQERIVRVIGEDGTEEAIPINRPLTPEENQKRQAEQQHDMQEQAEMVQTIFDLTLGKYDLTVTSGPSFTTRREEAATSMHQFIQAFPPAAPMLMDLMAKNLDWPGADEVAKRMKKMLPPQVQQEVPPQVQAQMQQMKQMGDKMMQDLKQMGEENAKLKLQLQNKQGEVAVKQFEADTNRIEAVGSMIQPSQPTY